MRQFFVNVWMAMSLLLRWILLLALMFVCFYFIETIIGFMWYHVMGESNAVDVIFKTVLVAFFCAIFQVFVGIRLYKYGEEHFIKPAEVFWKCYVKREHHPKDVFGEPLTDVFGDPVDFICKVIPFPWRKMETLWDIPKEEDEQREVFLFLRKNKWDSDCFLCNEPIYNAISFLEDMKRHGAIYVGWAYAEELADYLRKHSVVPNV